MLGEELSVVVFVVRELQRECRHCLCVLHVGI